MLVPAIFSHFTLTAVEPTIRLMVGSTTQNANDKCNDCVVALGGWSFTRIEPHGTFSEKRSGQISTLWKIIYWMQCLSYDMCSSMLSLKFFVYSNKHSAQSEHRDQKTRQVVVTYKKLKTMGNHYLSGPKSGRRALFKLIFYW